MHKELSKKAMILGPVLSDWNEINIFKKQLDFLSPKYELDFVDSLSYMSENDFEQAPFELYWNKKINESIKKYEVFIAFSLGGVILQRLLHLFKNCDKKIILISVPSFLDHELSAKLNKIISFLESGDVISAINILNKYVSYPYNPLNDIHIKDLDYTRKVTVNGTTPPIIKAEFS